MEKDDIVYALGQIDAKLEGIDSRLGVQGGTLTRMDVRVGKLETRAAFTGGKYGAAAAAFIAIGFEIIKAKMGVGGG